MLGARWPFPLCCCEKVTRVRTVRLSVIVRGKVKGRTFEATRLWICADNAYNKLLAVVRRYLTLNTCGEVRRPWRVRVR
jgi:hypothetical protein